MTPISVTYSDERLRTLVEEFITMQKHEFTFKEVCSYVLLLGEGGRQDSQYRSL